MSSKPKKQKAKRKSPIKERDLQKIELEPDAMQRLERAIGMMAPARRKKAAKK